MSLKRVAGAEGEIRTPTSVRSPVPETGASTNSATSAQNTSRLHGYSQLNIALKQQLGYIYLLINFVKIIVPD